MTTLLSSGLLIIGLASAALLLGVLLALSIWRGTSERATLQAIIADLREREAELRRQIDATKAQLTPPRLPEASEDRGVAPPVPPPIRDRLPVLGIGALPAGGVDKPVSSDQKAGLAILVAEDNPVNRVMAVRQLERLGYAADSVINGREAVDAVRRQRYDLILMDLQMPELDGDLAARAIRSLGDAVHQPAIVAITANVMDGDRERCLAAGMDDYLSKPVLITDLRQILGRVTPPSDQTAPIPPAPPQLLGENSLDLADLIDKASIAATLDTLSDDYTEARETLIGLYRDEIPLQIEGLTEAMGLRDRNDIRQAAHKLLGGCRQLGAVGMASRCAALERSASDAPLADLVRQIADIRTCYQATMRLVLKHFTLP
jgi:CheY-like chemotaxis protein/HPt (histidine-containing phosphotransfer) domain-containing protein